MKSAITLGLVLASVVVSRLFIFSFRHIPLTYQSGGQEPIYALVRGVALAFSAPTVPLLIVYLAVLFTARKAAFKSDRGERGTLLPAGLFLIAFVIVFVITISGKPSLVANAVYRGRWIINLIGGLFIAFYGLKASAESGLLRGLRFVPVSRGKGRLLLEPLVLGFMAGLLLFHLLDPYYDSVFFLTGRAGAFSHHALSVSSFGLGLGALYVALAYILGLLIVPKRADKSIAWINGILGVLTLVLGLSFATGTFPSLAAAITKGH